MQEKKQQLVATKKGEKTFCYKNLLRALKWSVRKMRSTKGYTLPVCEKNELHLVTDGHDKKLKLKQPFFKLGSKKLLAVP